MVFLPYALIDAWQILTFIALGPDILAPGPYVLTDPSIYLPVTMMVAVVFYGFMVKRLWVSLWPPAAQSAAQSITQPGLQVKELV